MKKFILLVAVSIISTGALMSQQYTWSPLGGGTNGTVYASVIWNNHLIVAGGFTQAGGIACNNIAQWDLNTQTWSTLGSGFTDTVYALCLWDGDLVAAGGKINPTSTGFIQSWNEINWQSIVAFGNPNAPVKTLGVYSGGGDTDLYAGGLFTMINPFVSANHIAYTTLQGQHLWNALGTGTNNNVYSLKTYAGKLIVGGDFTSAGGLASNHIAIWNVSQWQAMVQGTDGPVYALTSYGSLLIVGGIFTSPFSNISAWNGSGWATLGSGADDAVYALAVVNNDLFAGGSFRFAGGLYGSRAAKWNGATWSRLLTGMNTTVRTFAVKDSNLYAGGNFITAGGKYASHVALWNKQPTVTISGFVTYHGSGLPVVSGKVQAQRLDVNTHEVIVVDSNVISNGNYLLDKVIRGDTVYIVCFPDDEFDALTADFVPTYHPSTIDWQNAVRLVPLSNLTNINVVVYPITPAQFSSSAYNISGHVYLMFNPPGGTPGLPYKSDGIVYAKQDSLFRKFNISNTYEEYALNALPAGTYQLYAYRLGYSNQARTVVLTNSNQDTINFYLYPIDIIGIHQISSQVPAGFSLYQNYPNPFNPETKIKFDIGGTSVAQTFLSVYDILGREVIPLINEKLNPGTYEISINASNLPSGVYLYRLTYGDFAETRKMILIK